MRRRVEYIENTTAQFDYESRNDWSVAVDRKTGVAYSGFPPWTVGIPLLFLREDVELLLMEEESPLFREDLEYLPYSKAVV